MIRGLEYCLEERHIQLEEDQKRNYEFVKLDRGNKMYRDNLAQTKRSWPNGSPKNSPHGYEHRITFGRES